jgi:accessory colonization factor AcfC
MNTVIAGLVLLLVSFGLQKPLLSQDKCLRVYGSSGPLGPIRECGEVFSKYHGIEVRVVGGPVSDWAARAEADGDVVFGGAEYVLTQFITDHPNLIDKATRTSLYVRAVGILVREGNPKQIRSLVDLTRVDMRLLVVNGVTQQGLWEDAASTRDLVQAIQKRILISVPTSEEAIKTWKSMPGIDAWITYESWHYRLKDVTDLVQLPEQEKIYRGTPIAITKSTKNKEMAVAFIAFLKTDAGHAIFQKWGWK